MAAHAVGPSELDRGVKGRPRELRRELGLGSHMGRARRKRSGGLAEGGGELGLTLGLG